ncbi:MAG: Zn-dependent hydrolase [Ginsengibacter sp.]
MKNFQERALTIQQRINELTEKNHASPLFGSPLFIEYSQKIAGWMNEAGLETFVDNIGNIRGKLKNSNADGKTFLIGSHFDKGIYENKNDGILGILIGLEIIENVKQRNIRLPFDIELIAFAEEEGARFNYNKLGSKVIAGKFENKLLQLQDEENHLLSETLAALHFDPEKIKDDSIPAEKILAYFEIHPEPGFTLFDADVPVGVVDSMYGQKRIEIIFSGKDGHAGTLAMHERNDALAAAAKFILQVEKYAKREKKNLRATVGKINVSHPLSNKIAGKVSCSLDIRSDDADLMSRAYEEIYFLCEKTCDKRNIYFEWKLIQESDPVVLNKKLRKLLEESVKEKNTKLISFESGAIYDAAIIGKVAPSAMLFVKSIKDNNHHPIEDLEKNTIAKALEISELFVQKVIAFPEQSFRKKEK